MKITQMIKNNSYIFSYLPKPIWYYNFRTGIKMLLSVIQPNIMTKWIKLSLRWRGDMISLNHKIYYFLELCNSENLVLDDRWIHGSS